MLHEGALWEGWTREQGKEMNSLNLSQSNYSSTVHLSIQNDSLSFDSPRD